MTLAGLSSRHQRPDRDQRRHRHGDQHQRRGAAGAVDQRHQPGDQVSSTSGDDVALGIGLTDSAGAFATQLQAAQPSIVTIDQQTITSDGNELTDVVPGLSISLLQTTSTGQTVTLDVEANYDDIKTAITSFITAYNALRDFVVTNQTVGSDGTVPEDAVLFADSILRDANRQLSAVLSGSPTSADDDVADLADLGITFDANNQLELSSETTLDNLLLTNLSAVASFFETSFTSDNAGLKLMKNATAQSFDFSLDVTATDGVITGVSVGGEFQPVHGVGQPDHRRQGHDLRRPVLRPGAGHDRRDRHQGRAGLRQQDHQPAERLRQHHQRHDPDPDRQPGRPSTPT
jgi:hypothetical protein